MPQPRIFKSKRVRQVSVVALVLFVGFLSVGIGRVFLQEDGLARVLDAQVKRIMVEGALNVDQQELRGAIGLNYGDPLIGFDASKLRESIEALPWVASAVVERRLPSSVNVKLFEKKPLALWQDGDDRYVLDRDGERIVPASHMFAHLPLVMGQKSDKNVQSLFAMIAESPHLSHKITSAEFIGERRWNLMFENGVMVQLPEDNSANAMKKLKKLDDEKQVMQVDDLVIDLRVEDRIILRLPENVDLSEGWPPQGQKNSV